MRRLTEIALLFLIASFVHSPAIAQKNVVPYPLWVECGSSTVDIVSARPNKLGGLFEIAPLFDISGNASLGPNDTAECKLASGKIVRLETMQEPESERGECGADQNNELKVYLDGQVVLAGPYASCFDIEPFAAIFIDERKNSMDVCYSSHKPNPRHGREMRRWVAVRCETSTLQ